MLEYYFKYLILTFVLFTIFYSIGHLLLFRVNLQNIMPSIWYTYFFKTISGLISSISIYSIIQTKGYTANILLIPVLFFAYQEMKKSCKQNNVGFIKQKIDLSKQYVLLELLFVGIVMFSWKSFFVLKPGVFPFQIPWNDHVYYNDIAQGLLQGMGENTLAELNYFYKQQSVAPYHYFDAWLAAFSSFWGTFSVYLCQYLSGTTLLNIIVYMGIRSLLMDSNLSKPLTIILSLCFFAHGFSGYYFKNQYIGISMSQFNGNPPFFLQYEKITILYIVFTAVMLWWKLEQKKVSIYFLILCGLIYHSILPFIFSGIFIYFFLNRKQTKNWILQLSFIGVYTFLFFYLINNSNTSINYKNFWVYTDFNSSHYKIAFVEYFYRLYHDTFLFFKDQWYIYSFIFIIIIISTLKIEKIKKYRTLYIILGISTIIAFITRALVYKMRDSEQLSENIFPLFYVLGFYSLVILLTQISSKKLKNLLMSIFILIHVLNVGYIYTLNKKLLQESLTYDESFLMQVRHEFTDKKALVGAYFASNNNYRYAPLNELYVKHYSAFIKPNNQYWSVVDLNLDTSNIHVWNTSRYQGQDSLVVFRNPFFQFKNGIQKSLGEQQVMFIKNYRLAYAVVPPGGIVPEEVEEMIRKEIHDKISGTRFIIFKN